MHYVALKLSQNIAETTEGYIICKDVPIGRAGPLKYLAEEIGRTGKGVVTVIRTLEENNSPSTLASFEGKPVTLDHPSADIDIYNYNMYSKGHAQNIRKGEGSFKGCIIADLIITDKKTANKITSNKLREVSCGYDATYVEVDGVIYQTAIRGNHIAIVENGRAGDAIAIRDSAIKIKEQENNMPEKDLLDDVQKQIKDAEALMEQPKEPSKDSEIEEIKKTVDALCAREKAKDEEAAAAAQAEKTEDEEELKKMADELEEGSMASDVNSKDAENTEEDEKDVFIEDEDTNIKTEALDSAKELYASLAPVIASMPDGPKRKKAIDSLRRSLNQVLSNKNPMTDIVNRQGGATNGLKSDVEIQKTYSSMNAHYKADTK